MKKLPIYKYLDISTAHIKQETDDFLRRQAEDEYGDLVVYKKECGYFICVPDKFDMDYIEIPDDLRRCLELAEKHNCYWLVLDCDAEVIDELETYDW
jgi:hypothetical protein